MAIEFDGSTDHYINVGDVAALDSIGAISVAVWARTDTLAGGTDGMRYVAGKEGASSLLTSFLLRLETTGDTWDFVVGGVAYVGASAAASVSVWTHLCGVYDGANVIIYRDGVSIASSAKTGNTGNGTALEIGSGYSVANRLFDGQVDDFRAFARALTAQEATVLAAGYRGPLGGEVVWLSCDDFRTLAHPDGTTLTGSHVLPDLSGNGNDGTPTSGPIARASDAPRVPTWLIQSTAAGFQVLVDSFTGAISAISGAITGAITQSLSGAIASMVGTIQQYYVPRVITAWAVARQRRPTVAYKPPEGGLGSIVEPLVLRNAAEPTNFLILRGYDDEQLSVRSQAQGRQLSVARVRRPAHARPSREDAE